MRFLVQTHAVLLAAVLAGCGSAATLRVGQARPELDMVQLGQQGIADQALLIRVCGDTEAAIAELVHRGVRLEAATQRIGAAADAIFQARARPLDKCEPKRPATSPSPSPSPSLGGGQ